MKQDLQCQSFFWKHGVIVEWNITKEKDHFMCKTFHWKSVAGGPFRVLLQLATEG